MADLNSGKGKFWGVDSSVKYADSFKGATKVAEKVKKGGTETKSDGYVVDAIDIDWGGLKLTTIDNGWSQKTISSTEQNAGKGDNTQGIHSTAYLLNLISGSFDQIYNQIGGNDNAGLRQKIKTLETSINQITGSTPGKLEEIKNRIQKIEQELDNPGAASTLVTILDTLDGFDKNTKGDVKKYINDRDNAILGSTTDAATAYTVYGVRKYVDEKAETSYTNAVNKANEYTNQAIGTAESTLIGSTADAVTANTIWGAKNYANTTVKNSLLGASGDAWPTKHTIYGVAKYATTVQSSLLGASGDAWPTKQTLYGVVKYSDTKNTDLKQTLIGNTADTWPTKQTLYGVVKYSDTKNTNLKNTLIGTSTDATIDTHYGLKHILIGKSSDAATADTIWGAKNYADEANASLLGTENDDWVSGKKTIYGAVNGLIGSYDDDQNSDSIWAAKNYADFKDSDLENKLIGTASDHTDSNTIWGAKNYAKNQISVTKYNQLTAQVIEENGEGILEFLTVSSYLG